MLFAVADKNIQSEVARIIGETNQRDENIIANGLQVKVQCVQVPKEVVDGWLSVFGRLNFGTEPNDLEVADGEIAQLWYEGPTSVVSHK